MESIDKPTALVLTDLLWQYGVTDVVVSPGSRCAPIVVALHRSGKYRLTTIIDERSAAFVALGMARASERPVAMVCTSGSALLNYGPTLAEAYYSHIPLIAISADRPEDIIDQRDGQTIRQAGALEAVVRTTVNVGDVRTPKELAYANRMINNALTTACYSNPQGPVHINMQFEMPLTPLADIVPGTYGRKLHLVQPQRTDMAEHMASISPHARVMVIIGALPYSSDMQVCVAAATTFVTIAEVQANINIPCVLRPDIVAEADIETPDIIVTMGGSLVSAPFKKRLRHLKGVRHISVGFEAEGFVDTYGMLSESIECEPLEYLQALVKRLVDSSYYDHCHNSCKSIATTVEPTVEPLLHAIANALGDADVHLSNGMSVRYGQYLYPRGRVFANRGVSGIEGSTSTAIGSAMASGRPTILITGDMGAAYDIGALAIADIPDSFRIVVLNNCGGDIFRHVATTCSLPEREAYFAVPPKLPLRQLAEAYGFDYFETTAEAADISAFMAAPRKAILNCKM